MSDASTDNSVHRADASARPVQLLSALVALGLLICIVWAGSASNVVEGTRYLAGDRWGIVTLLDVYAGALVVAVWMWVCQRSFWTWLLWVVALLCLGHFVSMIYLLVRASQKRTLRGVFTPAGTPPRSKLGLDDPSYDGR